MKSFINFTAIVTTTFMLTHCESPESAKAQNIETTPTALDAMPENLEQTTEKRFDFLSGPVVLHGEIGNAAGVEGASVKLYETEGRDYFLIDSAKVYDKKFSFTLPSIAPGLYKIGVGDPSQLGEIILNPKEPEVSFLFFSSNFGKGFSTTDSRENEGLKEYMAIEKNHNVDLQRIRSGSGQNKRQEIYSAQANLKTAQDAIAQAYPGTFLSNFVQRLQSPNRFSKERYWNDIDFHDVSLIRSPVFPSRVEDYMRVHASAEKSPNEPMLGFYNAVDRVANIIKDDGSDEVLQFVLYTLSEGFYSSGMEDLSLYVVDNYFYGDACGDADISELFKMKAAGIRNLQVGNTPPDFTLLDPAGNKVEFGKIARNSKFTLLMFWASFCHKCEREIPEVKAIYEAKRRDGFDVVAVSVDTDRNAWTKAVRTQQISWHNASDIQGWRSPVAKDFRVTSTPVMFVVDGEGEIVSKPKSASELASFLNRNL